MIFNFLVLPPLSIWPFGVFKRILAFVAMSYGKTEYLPQGDKDFPKRQDVNFLVLPIGYEPFNLSRCDPVDLEVFKLRKVFFGMSLINRLCRAPQIRLFMGKPIFGNVFK